MTNVTALDHAVVNVRYQMDQAVRIYSALGFQLTERGFHTLGSINHLMMFGSDYLELIGLPAEKASAQPSRLGIADAPLGINALVFKTTDVDAVYAHLQRVSMAAQAPNAFSRPVQLPDGQFDASFRTVHVKPGVFPGGRIYFCQHLTPELVWRDPWTVHANSTSAVNEFVVVAKHAIDQANKFSTLLNVPLSEMPTGYAIPLNGCTITVCDLKQYQTRYGALALAMQDRDSMFGAIVLRANMQSVRDALAATDPQSWQQSGGAGIVLRESQFETLLEWVPETSQEK